MITQERFEELAKLAGNKLEDFEAVKKAAQESEVEALAEAEMWKARADAMLNVADYEIRKQILEGRFP